MKGTNNTAKVYFPGLNGLRFLAALLVIIGHIEMFKGRWSYPNIWRQPLVFTFGDLGVDFFFVLSGFLITYLLFVEKETTRTVAVGAFLLRRVFRIWPLYFLIVILAFFVLPQLSFFEMPYFSRMLEENFWSKLLLFVFILPNVALAFFPTVPYAGMSWSIGVEEQFYILWPLLIKYTRKPLRTILMVIGGFIGLKVAMVGLLIIFPGDEALLKWKELIVMTRIECMAIGAIGAYLLYFRQEKWLRVIYHRTVQWGALMSLIPLVYLIPEALSDGNHIIFSAIFLIIVMNVASNPHSILKLETPLLHFLGKISFGLYMYHMILIVVAINWLKPMYEWNTQLWNVCLYGLSICFTIVIAALSYEYVEKPFIKLKRRYTRVVSGEDAKEKTKTEMNIKVADS